jgi:hypothetical protein
MKGKAFQSPIRSDPKPALRKSARIAARALLNRQHKRKSVNQPPPSRSKAKKPKGQRRSRVQKAQPLSLTALEEHNKDTVDEPLPKELRRVTIALLGILVYMLNSP